MLSLRVEHDLINGLRIFGMPANGYNDCSSLVTNSFGLLDGGCWLLGSFWQPFHMSERMDKVPQALFLPTSATDDTLKHNLE